MKRFNVVSLSRKLLQIFLTRLFQMIMFFGHFSHRWPVGDWSNPFHPGRDGTAFETVILYMQWIQGQPSLLADLYTSPSRENPGLPHSQPCHGDVLAAKASSNKESVSRQLTLSLGLSRCQWYSSRFRYASDLSAGRCDCGICFSVTMLFRYLG